MGEHKRVKPQRDYDVRQYVFSFPKILAERIKLLAAAREKTEQQFIREAVLEAVEKEEVNES